MQEGLSIKMMINLIKPVLTLDIQNIFSGQSKSIQNIKMKKRILRGVFSVMNVFITVPVLAADDCKLSMAEIYAAKSPAVVQISALTINPYRMDDRVNLTSGSGFIFDSQGLVMTNSHVVFGTKSLSVTLNNGARLPAKLLGADPIFDLAVLQIPVPKSGKLPELTFANSDSLRPGDDVVVIGNPMGLDRTITSGIVSAINRVLHNRPRMLTRSMIQTDTPINPGNSGGPILNRCGQVVGIASSMLGNAQNIGFAIPSNLATYAAVELVHNGRLIRPWLGIDGNLINSEMRSIVTLPQADGFLVESVEPNSPANLAGITGGVVPVRVGLQSLIVGGDVILELNEIKLKDIESLIRAFDLVRIGASLKLKILRGGKTFTKELKITERPLQPGDVPESSQYFSVEKEPESGKGKAN